MNQRFLLPSTAVCVALVIGCSFSLSAIAADGKTQEGLTEAQPKYESLDTTYGRERRQQERATRYKERGKIKKYRKYEKKAETAKKKGEKQLNRALKARKKGRFERFIKHLEKATENGNGVATRLLHSFVTTIDDEYEEEAIDEGYQTEGERDPQQEAFYRKPDDIAEVYFDAQRGNDHALFVLGTLHQGGEVLELDLSLAYAMFSHAAKRGNGQASDALEKLVKILNLQQLSDGKASYKRWENIIKTNQTNSAFVSK